MTTRLVVETGPRILRVGDGGSMRDLPCAIGRSGACPAADKREGDGMTPRGTWSIRGLLLRPDRIALDRPAPLPWRWIAHDDGWSDDPLDPAYNRPVRHPHRFSAERLWREDGLYDLIVALGYNDAPPVAGQGSAIFLHGWRGGAPTEGCVAIDPVALRALAPTLRPGDALTIV